MLAHSKKGYLEALHKMLRIEDLRYSVKTA